MKIDRLMAITMYLLNRGIVSASALAERFEVSKRTIQRDIETLNQAGIPIVSTFGTDGGYEIIDGFKLTKQIAGVEDYLNIIIALKGLSSAYENEKIDSTLEKLLSSMKISDQKIFIDFTIAKEKTYVKEYFPVIEKAICDKTPLTIEYTNAEQVFSKRLVEPLSLSFRWYSWYLFGYSVEKQDYRLYKLSRILSCKATLGVFSKEHDNVEELMKNIKDNRKYYSVKLLCKKEIKQQVFEYLTCTLVEELGNGDFVVSMNVPFEQMWVSMIMGFGNKLQVLEPVELKTMLKQKAEEILSVY